MDYKGSFIHNKYGKNIYLCGVMVNKGKVDIRGLIQCRVDMLSALGGIRCGTLASAVVYDEGVGYRLHFDTPDATALFQLDVLIRRNSLN